MAETIDMAIKQIKTVIKTEKAIIGTENTVKELRRGNISKIFMSANAPADAVEKIEYYSKLADAKIITLEIPNDELGVICQKPFSISVLGVRK